MSKKILLGTAALIALGTATFTGTAFADGGHDNANAVGCSASNTQNNDLIPVNAIAADAVNGNNVLANCHSSASAG